MELDEAIRQRLITSQRLEITEHHIYKRLARVIRPAENQRAGFGRVKQVRVKNCLEIRAEPVPEEPGVTVRWLITELEEQPEFAMRLYEIEPGGVTTAHTHYWEHQVFILSGQGVVIGDENGIPLGEGDMVYVPPLERHQFANKGDKMLRFLMTFPIPRGK